MKVFARVLSIVLVALMLALTFTSCAIFQKNKRVPEGEYIIGDKSLEGFYEGYTFDGKEFSYNVYFNNVRQDKDSFSGTYEFEKNKDESDKDEGILVGVITFTYTWNGEEITKEMNLTYTEEDGKLVLGDLIYYLYEDAE